LAGKLTYHPAEACGDFVIYKKDATASYQLAVVVDDAATGVDAVVRGDDLLDSTPRQILLRRLLGLAPEPQYLHLPLVVGPDGRRLAKRHGDTRLSAYRRRGTDPQRLLGLLGWWSGLLSRRRPAQMEELLARFDPAKIPRQPVVWTPEDDAFLLGR
jgi:glutamyl-tRNA synthetase